EAVAESRKAPFSGPGKDLHQRAATNFRSVLRGEPGQAGEGQSFALAMRSLHARVHDQQYAPVGRKGEPTDGRGKIGVRPAPGVDHEPTAFKQGGANARACAAAEQMRIARWIGRKTAGAPKRRRDRERELGAGAQSRVRGNRAEDRQSAGRLEPEAFGDA